MYVSILYAKQLLICQLYGAEGEVLRVGLRAADTYSAHIDIYMQMRVYLHIDIYIQILHADVACIVYGAATQAASVHAGARGAHGLDGHARPSNRKVYKHFSRFACA